MARPRPGVTGRVATPRPQDAHGEATLRDRLSRLQGILTLSLLMTESGDEGHILELAATSVPSLGSCRLQGVHLLEGGWRTTGAAPSAVATAAAEPRLAELGPASGEVAGLGAKWGWAFSLRSLEGHYGHLVVAAPAEPASTDQFLLRVLAQQAGVALANARLHARERATAQELMTANDVLAETVAALERRTATHDRFTRVAASGAGLVGIARALYELTGYAAAIEDRHGNLRAWAGPGRPDPYPKGSIAGRERLVGRARREGGPIREGGRILAASDPDQDGAWLLALIDHDGSAGEEERVAVEYGATVLALEAARLGGLAEVELRLRRDLVEELLAGTDAEGALARSRALGYDLERPHRVVVVESRRGGAGHDELLRAVRRAAGLMEIGSLMVARGAEVVVLSDADGDWASFAGAVDARLRDGGCRVGVGELCAPPAEVPRSHRQARLALRVLSTAARGRRVAVFGELGVYRLLAGLEETQEAEGFLRVWLGPLLDYDAARGAALVDTLSRYLECGGGYDATAAALNVHRSTLRYRLKRIAEVSGHDLRDPETAFNLQLAARARQTLAALREEG